MFKLYNACVHLGFRALKREFVRLVSGRMSDMLRPDSCLTPHFFWIPSRAPDLSNARSVLHGACEFAQIPMSPRCRLPCRVKNTCVGSGFLRS